jgi:hypothetical protein
MPVYKGNAEVTSGSLKKGATNIENGYKQTDQFYVNTNAITINFVDAISGATMSTTQFSSIGTPGTAFSSFTRTISVTSGRVWLSNPTVSESGDTGGNVNASISGITSTSATLNVSGTHPNTGVTVTLTVNGSTQVQLPNLNVSQNGNFPAVATADGGSLSTVNYSVSNSSGCSGGTSGSGSYNFGNAASGTFYSYSRPNLVAGPYGNGCGQTCNSTVTFSKSGYNAGSTTFSQTGSFPSVQNTCSWSPSSNPSGASYNSSPSCSISCPTCVTCAPGSSSCSVSLSATRTRTAGGPAWGSTGNPSSSISLGSATCNNSNTITTAIPGTTTFYPINSSASITQVPNNAPGGTNAVTGGQCSLSWTYPSSGIGISASGSLITCQDTAGTSLTCSGLISSFSGGASTNTTGGLWRIQCSGGNGTVNASSCSGTFRLVVSQTNETVNMNF